MYRQGLGDCFLVSFSDGSHDAHMLIDCGTLGVGSAAPQVAMSDVVTDIKRSTNDHLDLLVVTHEHKDHVSGLLSERDGFEPPFEVDRVWAAWTENPKDELALKLKKYQRDLRTAVALAADALTASGIAEADEKGPLSKVRYGVRQMLDFYGDLPPDDELLGAKFATTVDKAMRYAVTRAGEHVSFLEPGGLIEPPWLNGVCFYVLGPPRDEALLKNMGLHGSPELYGITAEHQDDFSNSARFQLSGRSFAEYRVSLEPEDRESLERRLAFDPRFRIESADEDVCRKRFKNYYEDDVWRQIDHEWLSAASDLALQLDSYTNNTSLVLAIELGHDGPVLLFAADAQLGNWLSWHDYTWKVKQDGGPTRSVMANDLLRRTVFYKVGHHGSHNATIKDKGLELMQRDDLVAMIPVDREVALKKRPPWQMPATGLYRRLLEKTRGRVLRSDTGWPSEDEVEPESKDDWAKARKEAEVTVTDLFIDFLL